MNQLKTVVLLAALAGLFVVVGGAIGGKSGALIALILAAGMNFASYWFSDKVVLSMYGAKELREEDAPELYSMVRELTRNANLPMPKLAVIPDESPNAFATGRNPENAVVAVTSGITRLLSREELAGVIGHELAHVKNRDILIQSVAATIGAAITYLTYIGLFFGGSDDEEGGGSIVTMILMMILAPIAAGIIQMAISRSGEYRADATGARICGHPMWLASALRKLASGAQRVPMRANEATAHMFIVKPFSARGMAASLFSTHPPIEERVARLQEMTV